MAVISDRRFSLTGDEEDPRYRAYTINASEYYPFGLEMEGRKFNFGNYRFGFNGKEADTDGEWGGEYGDSEFRQTHYDYGFRIYNPSIGKFLSVDPLAPDYPWYTPYQFAGNSPILNIDLDGLEPVPSLANYQKTRAALRNTNVGDLLLEASTSSFNARPHHWWQRAHNMDNNNGNARWNAIKGNAGESVAASIAIGWGKSMSYSSLGRMSNGTAVVTYQFNPVDRDEEFEFISGNTWDFRLTFSEIGDSQGNTFGIDIVGYDFSGRNVSKPARFEFRGSNFSGRLDINFEVKTTNPNRSPTSLTSDFVKGLRQAIANLSNGNESVLMADKAAWQKAASTPNGGLMQTLYHRFTDA
ncbi:RHS repeat domain-containing protein [Lewinella sp. LCG006]|uniref:RHS repeat domain-containing protein n=1 Tax=Lewinella sp. LCG006 TaxID=3231911 RepID=UPI003461742A